MAMKNCIVCGMEFAAKGPAKTCGKVCSERNRQNLNLKYVHSDIDAARSKQRAWYARNLERERQRSRRQYQDATIDALERKKLNVRRWYVKNTDIQREKARIAYRLKKASDPEKYNESCRERYVGRNYRINVIDVLYGRTGFDTV